VPYFTAALHLIAQSDDVLTVSESAARAVAGTLPITLLEPPVALPPYAVHLLWHPRLDSEPTSRWLRGLFVQAAAAVTPPGARRATRRGRDRR
jgi:DNA-binding transcriptional LysR family regulator